MPSACPSLSLIPITMPKWVPGRTETEKTLETFGPSIWDSPLKSFRLHQAHFQTASLDHCCKKKKQKRQSLTQESNFILHAEFPAVVGLNLGAESRWAKFTHGHGLENVEAGRNLRAQARWFEIVSFLVFAVFNEIPFKNKFFHWTRHVNRTKQRCPVV